MKRSLLVTSALLLALGCAPYKQLKPKVELSPAERGYIELKKDEKKDFKLKEGKQYFIAFPRPTEDHFYLVISLKEDPVFKDALTASLQKKKIPGKRIKDESPEFDTLSVFAIDTKAAGYFWLIEKVKADQDPLAIRKIADDAPNGRRQNLGERRCRQNLVFLGQLGVLEHVDHLEGINTLKLGLKNVAQCFQRSHGVRGIPRHIQLEDVSLAWAHDDTTSPPNCSDRASWASVGIERRYISQRWAITSSNAKR